MIAFNGAYAKRPDPVTFGQQSPFATLYNNSLDQDTEVVEGPATPATDPATKLALTPSATDQARPVATDTTQTTSTDSQVSLGVGGATSDGQQSEEVRSYTVEGGDTLSSIAQKFGISTNTVLWANNLADTAVIKPGQTLTILPVSGVAYTVQKNDTTDSIAKKFNSTTDKILAFNRITGSEGLNTGDQIIIPDGSITPTPQPTPTPTSSSSNSSSNSSGKKITFLNIPAPSRVAAGARLLWPAIFHKLNQYFHYGHTGIDIDARVGQPIYAASDGVVSEVKYERYGYGFHVVINHGGGMSTLYAHQSKIIAHVGQTVSRGDIIGYVGMTGRTTGPHLHFEVRINNTPVNPLSYL